MLPVVEPDGRRTGRQALVYAAALWPVSLLPTFVGSRGISTALSRPCWASTGGARRRVRRDVRRRAARRLFLESITYLPLSGRDDRDRHGPDTLGT